MKNLYYIRNVGCDDETIGLAEILDEDFPKFKEFIENLNKNSTYRCMPIIEVYKVTWDLFREAVDGDSDWPHLYIRDTIYVPKSGWLSLDEEQLERVI